MFEREVRSFTPAEVEKLREKAQIPGKLALIWHQFYGGKIEIAPKCAILDLDAFGVYYTPGVAQSCKKIMKHPESIFEQTNKANTIAVFTNETRVLGLGDLDPGAGLPVMEGKALLFKYLGGVDAYPLCLDTDDPEEFIRTALILQPSFVGYNLEDISQPNCFYILEKLREKAEILVMHDDQQGTATVTLAAFLNALHLVDKQISQIKICLVGFGAANFPFYNLVTAAGADPDNITICDIKGILGPANVSDYGPNDPRREVCKITNRRGLTGGTPEAMKGADVVIAYSASVENSIKPEWVSSMNEGAIVFACANPTPEIWPWDALKAGAYIVATGRSDLPYSTQVNNSMGFPAIFRGGLDVRATDITPNMCIAAAKSLGERQREIGLLDVDHLIPSMADTEAFIEEAVAVGRQAIQDGVARLVFDDEQLREMATKKIRHARDLYEALKKDGIILDPPSEN